MSESQNRNRNNRSNNDRRNRGPRNRNQQRDNKGSYNQHNNAQPRSRRRPRPKPLTFWQKVLKFLGLYKDPNAKPQSKGKPQQPKQGKVVDKRTPKNKKTNPAKKTPPTVVEGNRLYVGNLSYEATEYELEELFKGIGAVRSVELVYNRRTHKSKGYGFITMGAVEEAKRAVEVLHDQPFMGRKLIVNGARSSGPAEGDAEGRPREDRGDRGGQSRGPKRSGRVRDARTQSAPIPEQEEVHSLGSSD